MLKEAIILAGGLGTRLRNTIPDTPKCMAMVSGQPFIFYVINQLRSQHINKFIFALGYKHEIIEAYLQEHFPTLNYKCVIENEPLGTGGAIQLACRVATEKHVVVLNGDTIFKASLEESNLLAISHLAECSLLLKPMKNIDRYGIVEINEKNEITAFKEKKSYKEGLINAGCYILNVQDFLSANFPEVFSFEKDYLERFFGKKRIYGIQQDAYFIDIGIPEDYYRAQQEICHPAVDLKRVDKDWTLLLDRDGVINEEKRGGYILNWKEFKFFPDAKKSFSTLAQKFGKIIIVTNQRGVGKGDIPEETLHTIHENMKSEIEKVGGRIDMILYCASTDNLHPNRKPNPGMMFLAKKYYPEIELSKTIMVGNKLSDMAFAKNAGIFSVFLATTDPETAFPHPYIDLRFNSLEEFTSAL